MKVQHQDWTLWEKAPQSNERCFVCEGELRGFTIKIDQTEDSVVEETWLCVDDYIMYSDRGQILGTALPEPMSFFLATEKDWMNAR